VNKIQVPNPVKTFKWKTNPTLATINDSNALIQKPWIIRAVSKRSYVVAVSPRAVPMMDMIMEKI
jgi:hypothetical protein